MADFTLFFTRYSRNHVHFPKIPFNVGFVLDKICMLNLKHSLMKHKNKMKVASTYTALCTITLVPFYNRKTFRPRGVPVDGVCTPVWNIKL
jgi:hypothetical protein